MRDCLCFVKIVEVRLLQIEKSTLTVDVTLPLAGDPGLNENRTES